MPRRPQDVSLHKHVPDGEFHHLGQAETVMLGTRLCDDIKNVLQDHREEVEQAMDRCLAREELAIDRLVAAYGLLTEPLAGRAAPNGLLPRSLSWKLKAEQRKSAQHAEEEQIAAVCATASQVYISRGPLARSDTKQSTILAEVGPPERHPPERQDTIMTKSIGISSVTTPTQLVATGSLPKSLSMTSSVEAESIPVGLAVANRSAAVDSASAPQGNNKRCSTETARSVTTNGENRRGSNRRLSLQSLVSTVSKASRAMVRIITTEQPTELDNIDPSYFATYSQEVMSKKEVMRSVSRMTSVSRDQVPVSTEDEESNCRMRLRKIVNSRYFDQLFAFLIITNSVFIGLQVDHGATHDPMGNPPKEISAIQHAYAVLFLIELCLRLSCAGTTFFYNSDWKWNWLDLILVVSSVFEIILEIFSGNTNEEDFRNLSVLRIVRVIRLLRIARIVRILRFFRQLRILTYSIVGTLKSLVWAMILLCLIVYVFAIVFTQATSELQPPPEHDSVLTKKYGSLPRSAYTLFAAMSAGMNWDMAFQPLSDLGWVYSVLFLSYITFMLFAVTNVVTGVFCQTAMESAERDEDDFIQERLRSKATYVNRLEKLFFDIDPTNYGIITLADLEKHLQDERVRNFFAALDIDVYDAWSLYLLLDTEERGQLSIEQFVDGCLRLKGQARSIDMASMKYQNEWIMKKLSQLSQLVDSHFGVLYQRLPSLGPRPASRVGAMASDMSQYSKGGKARAEGMAEKTWNLVNNNAQE